MKCYECVWYVVTRQLTEEEGRMARLYGITVDVRTCALGGCRGYERFESRGGEHDES